MKKAIIFLMLLLSFSLSNCGTKDQTFHKLKDYANKVLEKDHMTAPHLFFLIPADSCGGIVRALIPYFNSIEEKERVTIVLIGRSKRELDFLSADITNRSIIWYDSTGGAFKRNLVTPSTPRLYKLFPGKKVEVEDFVGEKIKELPRVIDEFLKA